MVITVSVDVLVGVLVDVWMLGYDDVGHDMYNDVGDVIMEFYFIIMDIYI